MNADSPIATTCDLPASTVARADPPGRARAALEVVLCSGLPTQLAVAAALQFGGMRPYDAAGRLSAAFVFALSLVDTVLVLALVAWCLRLSRERPRDVLLGRRPLLREAAVGLGALPGVFLLVIVVLAGVRAFAPWLRNVPENPLAALLATPFGIVISLAVVVIAGGLREEIQRAFLLHRFTWRLGGPHVGLAVTSVAFGLGHTMQGWDAALVTGVLGAAWGLLYLRRRSAVAGIVSHALFNSAEVVRAAFFS